MSFIAEAAAAANIDDYKLLLIDCDEETRAQRLMIGRSQPEHANADMMSWAAYLRSEATRHGYDIRDTSRFSLDQCVAHVLEHPRERTP